MTRVNNAMKQMTCPINGTRPISEFFYGGDYRPMPDPNRVDDATWADYIFNQTSVPRLKQEWWCHTPSNTWFIAERHTLTDDIQRTYLYHPDLAMIDPATPSAPEVSP